MEYVQMTLDEWLGIKQKLEREIRETKEEVVKARKGFIRIGYLLRQIKDKKLYEQDGYGSITEFAQKEYGLSPSDTSHLIKLNQEYSVDGYSETLRPEYMHLGKGQLVEMMGLPEKDRTMVRPEVYRENIRELKRFNREAPDTGVADDLRQLASRFYEDNPGILKAIYKRMPFGEQGIRRFAETVNPGGNRSYRKGLYFLMMYEDRVSVKKFGEDPRDLDWQQFYELTIEAVGEAPPEAPEGEGLPGPAGETEEETGDRGRAGTAKEPRKVIKPGSGEAEEVQKAGASGEGGAEEAGAPQENSSEEQASAVQENSGVEQDRIPAGPEDTENSGEGQDNPWKRQPAEKVIAPAQKHQEIQVKEAPLEPMTEEGNREETLPETAKPGAAGTLFETRKEYLDNLTAEEAAGYIRDEYDRHNLQASYLAYQFQLAKWLLEKVDGQGVTARE